MNINIDTLFYVKVNGIFTLSFLLFAVEINLEKFVYINIHSKEGLFHQLLMQKLHLSRLMI